MSEDIKQTVRSPQTPFDAQRQVVGHRRPAELQQTQWYDIYGFVAKIEMIQNVF